MKGQYSTMGNTYRQLGKRQYCAGLFFQKSYLDKDIEAGKIDNHFPGIRS